MGLGEEREEASLDAQVIAKKIPAWIPRWEYRTVVARRITGVVDEDEVSDVAMNEFGDEGWELVAVTAGDGWEKLYFKRKSLRYYGDGSSHAPEASGR